MMKQKTLALAMAAILALGVATAQKAPTKKPAQAPQQTQTPGRIVLGTNQMAGDQGKFNTVYTIGTRNFVNITLTDAKFTVERFNIGDNSITPNKDQKVLVLTYTVHNPNKEITPYNGGTLKFTAVDQEDVNHEAGYNVTEKSINEPLNVQLKPAQKITVQTAILVPAKGTVPKLIVQHESGGAVLRYDLREVLKPLEAPFAGQGFDALQEVTPDPSTYVPGMLFDFKYMSNGFQERQLGPTTIPDTQVFFLPKFMVKKPTKMNAVMRLNALAVTEDGDRYPATAIYKASVDEHASSYLEYGQENAVRMVIVVPKKAKIVAVRMWESNGGDSRLYLYPVDAQFTKPSTPAASAGSNSTQSTQTGLQGDSYTTILKDSKGVQTMLVNSLQVNEEGEKKTEITVGTNKAILIEGANGTTLSIPATGEVLHAPKATGKEPETSLSYYSLAYANAAAPKPKKKNLLGQIAGNVLGNMASGLGQSLVSGAVLSGFGQASMPAVINGAVQSNVQGYAVHSLASQLGRAVLTSSQPVDGNGPEQLEANVTVDKNVYVQTTFGGKKQVGEGALSVDSAKAKQVSATDLYKRFADFMAQGLPK